MKLIHLIVLISCLSIAGSCHLKTIDKKDVQKLSFTAYVLMAKYGDNKDSLVRSLSLFDRAISLDKTNYNLYQNRAIAEWRLGRYTNSLKDIDQVLKLKQDFAEVKTQKGFMLEKLNRIDEATKCYQDAEADYQQRLLKNSNNVNSQVDIAMLTMFLQSKADGIAQYEKIHAQYPNNASVSSIGHVFYSFNRREFIDEQVGNNSTNTPSPTN